MEDRIPFFKMEEVIIQKRIERPRTFAEIMKAKGYDLPCSRKSAREPELVEVRKIVPPTSAPLDRATSWKAINLCAEEIIRKQRPELSLPQAVEEFLGTPNGLILGAHHREEVRKELNAAAARACGIAKAKTAGTARAEVLKAAGELRKADPKLSEAAAFIAAIDGDADLARRYRAEN